MVEGLKPRKPNPPLIATFFSGFKVARTEGDIRKFFLFWTPILAFKSAEIKRVLTNSNSPVRPTNERSFK